MQEIRDQLIENAQAYKSRFRSQYVTASGNFSDWMEAIHRHVIEILHPEIQKEGEHFIEYWPVYMMWANRERISVGLRWLEDGSQYFYTNKEGTFGSGYLCLTDKTLHLVCFASLSSKYRMFEISTVVGLLAHVLSTASGQIDRRHPTKHDEHWVVPYTSIAHLQAIAPSPKTEHIRMAALGETWEIGEFFADSLPVIRAGIRMGIDGELNGAFLSEPENRSTSTVSDLLAKLEDLHRAGVITHSEYQDKKRALLSHE